MPKVDALKAMDTRLASRFAGHGTTKVAAGFMGKRPVTSHILQGGAMVGGMALSIIGDTPPATAVTAFRHQPADETTTEWRDRINARRAAADSPQVPQQQTADTQSHTGRVTAERMAAQSAEAQPTA
jgi:hypothetical protein